MPSSHRALRSGLALFTLVTMTSVLPDASYANTLTWQRFLDGEGPTQCGSSRSSAVADLEKDGEFERLACGSYGEFFFGKGKGLEQAPGSDSTHKHIGTQQPQCKPRAKGEEVPAALNPPAAALATSDWTPCEEGTCLSDTPDQDWVALIDWNSSHGYEVAHTVQQASVLGEEDDPVNVKLFDLETPGIEAIEALGYTSDAHLLAQLCHLEEHINNGALEAPLALNLSLGRVIDAVGPGVLELEPLGWEIASVLEHLTLLRDVIPVAAAGNHQELEFPAAAAGVLSVGYYEPLAWGLAGELIAAPFSPADSQTLQLAYGIVLEPHADELPDPPGGDDPQGDELLDFYVPSFGSSYAAALTTGNIAGCVRTDPDCLYTMIDWIDSGSFLFPFSDGGDFSLSWDEDEAIPGSTSKATARLLRFATEGLPETAFEEISGETYAFQLEAIEDNGEPGLQDDLDLGLSWARLAKETEFGPSPRPRSYCRPCRKRAVSDNTVALSFTGDVPIEQGHQIRDLYLMTEGTLYSLNGNPDTYQDFLDAFELSQVKEVNLTGPEGFVDEAWSLTLVVAYEREADQTRYWSHTPVWTVASNESE